MPIVAGFARRENPDHTIDSICKSCFRTVATTKNEPALIRAEEEHFWTPRSVLRSLRKNGCAQNSRPISAHPLPWPGTTAPCAGGRSPSILS